MGWWGGTRQDVRSFPGSSLDVWPACWARRTPVYLAVTRVQNVQELCPERSHPAPSIFHPTNLLSPPLFFYRQGFRTKCAPRESLQMEACMSWAQTRHPHFFAGVRGFLVVWWLCASPATLGSILFLGQQAAVLCLRERPAEPVGSICLRALPRWSGRASMVFPLSNVKLSNTMRTSVACSQRPPCVLLPSLSHPLVGKWASPQSYAVRLQLITSVPLVDAAGFSCPSHGSNLPRANQRPLWPSSSFSPWPGGVPASVPAARQRCAGPIPPQSTGEQVLASPRSSQDFRVAAVESALLLVDSETNRGQVAQGCP